MLVSTNKLRANVNVTYTVCVKKIEKSEKNARTSDYPFVESLMLAGK